ncbi:MAG: uroporphyrinogen-III synthase [Ignavibacteriae bacterium]|nr:uroporphyrinogen-III synthase [Ignavibacteriota bacterium]
MLRVLVTRAAHQATELVRLLEHNGFIPVLFPMIEIVPPESWNECDTAIESLYMYNGLIFTSANGVEFFFRRLTEKNVAVESLQTKIICVVGEKTKTVLEKHGLKITLMPEKFTSLDLANALQHQDIRGRTFLHPRGNLGNNMLPGNLKLLGATVDSVTVYQTIQPNTEEVQMVKTQILNDEIDILTFMSPSSIKNFCSMFTPSQLREVLTIPAVVIGPVTFEQATSTGFKSISTAKQSTIESLVKSIINISQSEIGNPKSEIQ